eukprot:g4971.t1
MNNKMGGDLEKIRDVGKYLIAVWEATGMNMERVEFHWTSDAIEKSAKEYWTQVDKFNLLWASFVNVFSSFAAMLDISRLSTLWRIKKCGMIMGRKDEEALSGAQILYPIMQCTDIFFLGADICQLGVDQRKVNMLAREYCALAGRARKPIILSHHMLYGLFEGQEKMSKSDPDSAIFMEDTEEDVRRKISKAYCPAKPTAETLLKKQKLEEEKKSKEQQAAKEQATVSKKAAKKAAKFGGDADKPGAAADNAAELEDDSMQLVFDALKNPIIDYIQHIIFADPAAEPLEIGGEKYSSAEAIKDDFVGGKISERDLKEAVITRVNILLQSVRKTFQENPEARAKLELVEQHKKAVAAGGPVKQTLRCLSQSPTEPVPSRVVFVPRPDAADINSCGLPLDLVLQTSAVLREAAEKGDGRIVLFIEDWSSFVLNKYQGETQVLEAYYALFLECLRKLNPALMKEKVLVKKQSDEILRDPNNYWISVIDVGRTCNLGNIRDMLPAGEDFVGSGQAVSAMMGVADVLALSCLSKEADAAAGPSRRSLQLLPVNHAQRVAFAASRGYIEKHIHPVDDGRRVAMPEVVETEVSKRLQQAAAVAGSPEDETAKAGSTKLECLVGDSAKALDKRVKKLYCCEGDVEKNPVLEYLQSLRDLGFLQEGGAEFFHVARPTPEDVEKFGPEQKFCSLEAIQAAFLAKELHPRDLKVTGQQVVIAAVKGVLAPAEDDKVLTLTPPALEEFAQAAFGKKKVSRAKTAMF